MGPHPDVVEPPVVEAIHGEDEKSQRQQDAQEHHHITRSNKEETPSLKDTVQFGIINAVARRPHIHAGPLIRGAWLWCTKCGWPFGQTGVFHAWVTAFWVKVTKRPVVRPHPPTRTNVRGIGTPHPWGSRGARERAAIKPEFSAAGVPESV